MEFLLEPGVVFLNHGSFGACPREVHEEYQRIQLRLESQPVRFLQRELSLLLAEARMILAEFIGAEDGEVVFMPNPTYAVNEIARSIRLNANDEVLVSDQEYGACLNAWKFMSQQCGFKIVQQPIPLPLTSEEQIVEQFWNGVTENTRVIFLSQITAPTALTIPVAEICRRARSQGILTIIDGAHAPGQIDVDVHEIGADFYTGACHKWLCAPKGSSFLFARREVQHLLEPLVVGWGWGSDHRKIDTGSDFLDYHEWLGTHDPSAYLTVPKAIEFQQQNNWPTVRARGHEMAIQVVDAAAEIPGVERVHPNEFFQQMALIELTRGGDADQMKSQFEERHIEVPIIRWNDRVFIRVSIQVYNTMNDLDKFVTALKELLS